MSVSLLIKTRRKCISFSKYEFASVVISLASANTIAFFSASVLVSVPGATSASTARENSPVKFNAVL